MKIFLVAYCKWMCYTRIVVRWVSKPKVTKPCPWTCPARRRRVAAMITTSSRRPPTTCVGGRTVRTSRTGRPAPPRPPRISPWGRRGPGNGSCPNSSPNRKVRDFLFISKFLGFPLSEKWTFLIHFNSI